MSYGLGASSIKRQIARFLGYSSDTLIQTSQQKEDIDDAYEAGLRRFYDPPPTRPGELSHTWSFLKNITTLDLLTDMSQYALPLDFQTIIGGLTYTVPSNLCRTPIKVIPSENLRRMQQRTQSGIFEPRYATIWFDDNYDPQIEFYPTPTEDMTVSYEYHVRKQPRDPDSSPLGGPIHSETILAACLAAAERIMEEGTGVHEAHFQERIRVSVDSDLRNQPAIYGYNGDGRRVRYDLDHRYGVIDITHENQNL